MVNEQWTVAHLMAYLKTQDPESPVQLMLVTPKKMVVADVSHAFEQPYLSNHDGTRAKPGAKLVVLRAQDETRPAADYDKLSPLDPRD